jgi:hypothetical protein
MGRPIVVWIVAAAVYAAFFAWYTGSGEPLTPEEIDDFMQQLAQEDRDADRLADFRAFLEADDGGDFIIANAILFHDPPIRVGDVGPDETAQQVLDRYMAFMWPELLRRACHPVIAGPAAITVEAWGVENVDRWSMAGLMRYRSRRDMLEIAGKPAFRDAHQFKVAAMRKTIAFTIEPILNLGDPRLLLGLLLFSFAATVQLLARRRKAALPRRILQA